MEEKSALRWKGLVIAGIPLLMIFLGNAPPSRPPQNPVLDVGCSLGTLNAREDFRSNENPTILEFVGKSGRELRHSIVTLSHADGRDPITLACAVPTLMLRLQPGNYMAEVDLLGGPTRTFTFNIPAAESPRELVFRFPSVTDSAA